MGKHCSSIYFRCKTSVLAFTLSGTIVWLLTELTRLSKNNDHNGYHTASNVARKATTFPLWSAIDKRWNRNTVSLVSSVTAVIRLPISWISSMADWFQVPVVSTATGKKICEAESAPYFTSVVTDSESATESADSSRVRPSPNPRIFCGRKWQFWVVSSQYLLIRWRRSSDIA